jgi:hypothetical protein
MPHEESLYPADWVRIAEKDLRRVDRLLDKHDPELAEEKGDRLLFQKG